MRPTSAGLLFWASPPARPPTKSAAFSISFTGRSRRRWERPSPGGKGRRGARAAPLAAAKPGVEAQAVDAAARQVIDSAGFGPNYAHFTHRLGHGIGMDGHEWPYLVGGDTLALAPAMCFSD